MTDTMNTTPQPLPAVSEAWALLTGLRRIANSPALDWARWTALQQLAKTILNETESPTETNLPPLEYNQTKRVEHRLVFRRH